MESLLIKASFAFTRASCLALQGWQLMEIGTPSFRMTIHLEVCVETSQGEILGMQPSKIECIEVPGMMVPTNEHTL